MFQDVYIFFRHLRIWTWIDPDIYVYVQSQKIVCLIRSRFWKNVKRGARSWDQLFPVHFLVRNMGKIVPHQNKNRLFGKSTKTGFPVLKYYFFCEKLTTYRYTFNTVKTLFVDFPKSLFLFWCGTIFPIFLTKKCTGKIWSHERAPLFTF